MSAETAVERRPAGVASWPRVMVVVFALAAGLVYRASVSLIPAGIAEEAFVLVVAALLAGAAVLARRRKGLENYWEIPYAFFVFYVAGFFGDGNVSPFQRWFVTDVLRESTSSNNPLASTVTGSVAAQTFGTLMLVIPIIVLTRASGSKLASIFIARPRNLWTLAIGVVCFVAIWFLAFRGRTESFFPIHGELTSSRFLALTPALVILVLLNGLREELFFRGLFLNKYGKFLRPVVANVLAAVIFTSFHVEVKYAASVLVFLVYTLVNGLILGWLMQRSGSLLASVIFHAGTDIPIFLVYLSYTT